MEKLTMSQNKVSSFGSKYTKFAPALRAGLLALALLAGFAPHAMSRDETTSTPTGVSAQQSYAGMVSRVAPAVVTVRSEKRARAPQQHPFLDDPTLRDFFGDRLPRGNQQPRERRQEDETGVQHQ